jgi:hypothetical protein
MALMNANQKKSVKLEVKTITSKQYDSEIVAQFSLDEIKKMIKAEELSIMKSARTGRFYLEAIIDGERALPNMYTAKNLDPKKPMQAILVKGDEGTAMILCNKQGTGTPPTKVFTV